MFVAGQVSMSMPVTTAAPVTMPATMAMPVRMRVLMGVPITVLVAMPVDVAVVPVEGVTPEAWPVPIVDMALVHGAGHDAAPVLRRRGAGRIVGGKGWNGCARVQGRARGDDQQATHLVSSRLN